MPSRRPPVSNLARLLKEQAASRPSQAFLRFHRDGAWRSLSYAEVADRARRIAGGLADWGVAVGERVAIFAENGPEWALADHGAIAAGAVVVSVYATLPGPEAAYVIAHSGARVAFVGTPEHAERLLAEQAALGGLEWLVLLSGTLEHPRVRTLEALTAAVAPEACAKRHDEACALGRESPLAITYTSGTTGRPKGVVVSHGNVLAVLEALLEAAPEIAEFDANLSFLPLAHTLERVGGHFMPLYIGGTITYARSLETVAEDLRTERPRYTAVVPRVLEKIHDKLQTERAKLPWARRAALDLALKTGTAYAEAQEAGRPVHLDLALRHTLAGRLVLRRIRERFGGRLGAIVCGGAPLEPTVAKFFHAIGLQVFEGWGLTETAAPATMNMPGAFRFGSVGRPLPGVELKLAGDGELLVRGPGVFSGYHADPEATAAAFDAEGYFRTGDIGRVDDQGYWYVTDRKKELIVNAAGKNIAPQKLENLLKHEPLISNAMVHGDRRPYLVALLTLDRAALAAAHPQLADRPSGDAELNARVAEAVERVNMQLPRFEQIKAFRLLDGDFTPETGELTVTLKLKRGVVAERHAATLDALYADPVS